MRKRFIPCLLLALCWLFPLTLWAANPVESFRSSTGLEGLLITDRSLPMVTMQLTFAYAGSVSDPEAQQGRAHFAASMLQEGAGPYDGQTFRKALEDKAIQLSTSAGSDSFYVTIKALHEHFPEAVRLAGIMLNQPRFELDAVARLRAQLLAELKQMQEDPGWHASKRWNEAAYPNHPYRFSGSGTEASLKALNQPDFKKWQYEWLTRDSLTISAVGDIDSSLLVPLLDNAFGTLPETRRNPLPEAAKSLPVEAAPLVVKQDIPQTLAIFGLPSIPRNDPDFYAAYVMNHILGGGGLVGRLSDALRQQRGLAYYASSNLSPMLFSSTLMGSFATRNDQAEEAVTVMQEVLKNSAEKGFTEEEVANAKEYLIGSFPLELDSQQKRVGYLSAMQLHKLGPDYLDRRNEYFAEVTLADVNRVAAKLLNRAPLTVLVGMPQGMKATTASATSKESESPAARAPAAAPAAANENTPAKAAAAAATKKPEPVKSEPVKADPKPQSKAPTQTLQLPAKDKPAAKDSR